MPSLSSFFGGTLTPQVWLTPLDYAYIKTLLASEDGRKQLMMMAWDAYYGLYPHPLRVDQADPFDPNVTINRIKPIVSTGVAFLFGSPPTMEIPKEQDGEGTSERSEDEKWLDEFCRRNRWSKFLNDLGTNGSVCGTPYARIWPPEEGEEFPRLRALQPELMTIKTDPRDIEDVTEYQWRYRGYNPETKRERWERQRIVRAEDRQSWTIIDEVGKDVVGTLPVTPSYTNGTEDREGFTQVGSEVWDYPWSPVLHCQNLPAPNCVYGEPDVSWTLIEGNRALIFNLSNRNKIDGIHGHPRQWAKGIDAEMLDTTPGKIIPLGDEGELGQLAPEIDSESPQATFNTIDAAMLEEASTPPIVLGREDGTTSNPSGTALKVKLWPLVNKTELKQALYGEFLIELMRRVFDLAGKGSETIVKLTWREIIPIDKLQEGQLLLLDSQMKIASRATLSTKRGYDWQQEQENMEKEAEADLERQKAQLEMQADAMPQPSGPGGPMPNRQMAQSRPRDQNQPATKPISQ